MTEERETPAGAVAAPGAPDQVDGSRLPDEPPAELVAELATLIAEAAGEETGWAAGIAAGTSLHDDLELESVELVALAAALRDRYGPTVDLQAYLVGLDLDQLIELTVGDLAGYLARCRSADPASWSGP